MPLTPGARMPRAFAIAGRLLRDPLFWGRRLFDLSRPGMLIAAALVAGAVLTMRSGAFGGPAMAETLFAALTWFSVPLLAHCWAPAVAREAAAALEIDASEGEDRSLLTFCWWWAMVTLLIAVPYIVGHELFTDSGWADWYFRAFGVLAAWLVSGFCIRVSLAGVVPRERLHETFVSVGAKPRLIWTAVLVVLAIAIQYALRAIAGAWGSGMVLDVAAAGMAGGSFAGAVGAGALLLLALGLASMLLMTTLWAAWSVQFVTPEPPEAGNTVTAMMTRPHFQQRLVAAPVAVEARPFPLLPVLVIAIVAAGALAWVNRLFLLDRYLQFRYPAAYHATPDGPTAMHRLAGAELHFACQGDVDSLRLLERVGFGTEHPLRLRDALHCAARNGRADALRYLLGRGVPADKARGPSVREVRYQPQTPLQWAVHRKHAGMVDALLAARVDPNQRTDAPTALALAAHAGQWHLFKRLRAAGARPDAVPALPVVFAWADGQSQRGTNRPDKWRVQLAAAEAAGVPVTAVDDRGRNLLHWAANRGEVSLAEVLLERGFAASEPDAQGAAPYAHLLLAMPPQAAESPELRKVAAALLAGQDLSRPVAGKGAFQRSQVTGWLAFPEGWTAEASVMATPWLHALVVAGPPAPQPPEPTGVPAPGAAGKVLPVSASPRR